MEFVDVHAHLTDERFNGEIEEIIKRAEENYTKTIITSACDLPSAKESVEIAKKHKNVFATIGFHPENIEDFCDETFADLKILANEEKVVAIGEIGLDYYHTSENKQEQKEVFIKQIEFANEACMPIVVHSRDAVGDLIEILKQHPLKRESLIHCYNGSVESAKILLNLGFSFSFGGVSTFSNAKKVVEVIKSLPIERIMLETDCPYLAPEPFRGQRNEPKNIKYIADIVARIKGMSMESVAQITTQNAKRVFKI